jgi:hypothetical protein
VLAALGFTLIAISNRYGGVSAFSYAVYFIVVFVWVGIAHPPRTSFALAPVAAVLYVVPLVTQKHPPPNAISSVTVAIPVCVLVAETIARTVRRQAHAQAALAERADLVEHLARLVGDLNADLDVDAVVARICGSAHELLRASATGFVTADDGVATVVAVEGLPRAWLGQTWPVADSSTEEVLRTRQPVVLRDMERYPYLMDELRRALPGLHTLLVIPSIGHGTVHGALYAVFSQPGRTLSDDEVDVAGERRHARRGRPHPRPRAGRHRRHGRRHGGGRRGRHGRRVERRGRRADRPSRERGRGRAAAVPRRAAARDDRPPPRGRPLDRGAVVAAR